MKSQANSTVMSQILSETNFDWREVQTVLASFDQISKSALCVLDFFDNKRIFRVKPQEALELHLTLSDEDWDYCMSLADGFRPIGSNVPHWLSELSDGVFSRSTCLSAAPVKDGNGLTIGLLYAFYAEGYPAELELAYQHLIAAECSSLIQRWQHGNQQRELQNALWTAIELSCPFFLLLNENMRVIRKGKLYEMAVPDLEVGNKFDDHFIWDGIPKDSQSKLSHEVKNKKRFYHSLKYNQRYKCSFHTLRPDLFLVLSAPVINANHAMIDYKVSASDFPPQDYITDFVFLHATASQNAEDLQQTNEQLLSRNALLEIQNSELVRDKTLLENRIAERNNRVVRLSNFPEQNPNPVFEVDFNKRFICFSNAAAKLAFGELLTLPYDEFLAVLSVNHDILRSTQKLQVEFESMGRFFIAEAYRVPHEDIIRFYANDASEIRLLRSRINQQQQSIKQLTGVLEALNVDLASALGQSQFSELLKQIPGVLTKKHD